MGFRIGSSRVCWCCYYDNTRWVPKNCLEHPTPYCCVLSTLLYRNRLGFHPRASEVIGQSRYLNVGFPNINVVLERKKRSKIFAVCSLSIHQNLTDENSLVGARIVVLASWSTHPRASLDHLQRYENHCPGKLLRDLIHNLASGRPFRQNRASAGN